MQIDLTESIPYMIAKVTNVISADPQTVLV